MKKFLPILLALSVVACAHNSAKIDGPPTVVISPVAPVTPPPVDPVNLQPVQWKVYNKESLRALVNQLDQTGENIVLFVVDGDNFKALSGNLNDIKRYIAEKNAAYDFVLKATKQDQPVPTARDK